MENVGDVFRGVGRLRETRETCVRYQTGPICPGGRNKMIVGRARETHKSLHVRYRESPGYPGGRKVDLGALETTGN